ncbi:5'/3'-nucleotidase SurE [Niveibacterium terrae]|uniref:5'/3'-nucleotidase SurE n=1 Tax=Niveibacterium terrae TaxID=3373598 RepID=UPI003A9133C8
MRILLSNDDGYFAPGIAALERELSARHDVEVVAPERNRSGASHSLTLDRPLSVRRAGNGYRFVDGTPTDCVHLAVTGLLPQRPELVISGINHGANMGDDTIYSGTVAAAMEGFLLGIPAIAVSLVGRDAQYFATAARVVLDLLEEARQWELQGGFLLNVNVPDLPFDQLNGRQLTRLGRRHQSEPVVCAKNPRGEPIYWVGAVGAVQDAGDGTDFHAVAAGFVSVTPLQIDLTHFGQMALWSERFAR